MKITARHRTCPNKCICFAYFQRPTIVVVDQTFQRCKVIIVCDACQLFHFTEYSQIQVFVSIFLFLVHSRSHFFPLLCAFVICCLEAIVRLFSCCFLIPSLASYKTLNLWIYIVITMMRIFFSLHFQLIFDPVFFYLMHMDTKSTYVLFHVRISSYLNIFHMIVSVCVVCSFAFLSQWLFQQKADTTKKQNILLFVFLFLCIIIIWWMLCLCTAPASQKFLC